MISKIFKSEWFPRVFPFLLFIFFIVIESLIDTVAKYVPSMVKFAEYDSYVFYPIKTVLVGFFLVLFWKRYTELRTKNRFSWNNLFIGLLTGFTVFVLWVNMDWQFATIGEAKEFDANIFGMSLISVVLVSFRLFGSSIVVPVFEELFWRSFVLRYIINPKFASVSLGKFTWMSFIISSVLFGLEHNLWLAGIMAGVAYALLLYYTRSLFTVILAHGTTNLLLGIYVMSTGNWQFW